MSEYTDYTLPNNRRNIFLSIKTTNSKINGIILNLSLLSDEYTLYLQSSYTGDMSTYSVQGHANKKANHFNENIMEEARIEGNNAFIVTNPYRLKTVLNNFLKEIIQDTKCTLCIYHDDNYLGMVLFENMLEDYVKSHIVGTFSMKSLLGISNLGEMGTIIDYNYFIDGLDEKLDLSFSHASAMQQIYKESKDRLNK